LASGGMAAVYVARALGVAGFERLFAVKVLHPHLAHEQEFITMFLDEARLAARIRHPNVVPTIDISDTQDAGYYLVMDYIEGDHLGALLQRAYKLGSKLPAPIALRIVADALEGLAAAHALTDETGRRINLVHRDVSPHNVMVSTDGIARITDFGVAKAEVRLMSTTRQGQFKGKLAYMAPEHASTGEADQRSDLFSAGIILWECLTGRRLFRAENQAATLNKICIEPIPMPSAVDPALAVFDPVLERALARDPLERYQTAEEFAEALEAHADLLGGLANQRSVGKLVREYAADKIDRDRELIRTAVAEIGSTGPHGDGSHQARSAPTFAHQSAPEAVANPAYAAAPPIQAPAPIASEPEATGPRYGLWVLGALAIVAVAVATWAVLMRGAGSEVTSTQLPFDPPAATTTSAATEPPAASADEAGSGAAVAGTSASAGAAAFNTAGAAAVAPDTGEAASAEPDEAGSGDEQGRPEAERPRHRDRPRPPPVTVVERPAPPPERVTKKTTPPAPPSDLLLNPYRK
ncbi:MAG TPA: serine/threonine-protein kinase, partial [Polyangiales bacterium]|nr:serine/threonine-protein kinase [Polyangiales bacterium]